MPTFGPGTLTIGDGASSIDASCLVNSLRIEPSKDEGDSKTMLCGTVKPGKTTYTYALTGSLDVDSDTPDGLFALCAANPGTQVPFTFTPSEGGTEASGTLILDPLSFGGDEFGDELDSDIEFSLVGPPLYSYPDDLMGFSAFAPIVINGRGAEPAVIEDLAGGRVDEGQALDDVDEDLAGGRVDEGQALDDVDEEPDQAGGDLDVDEDLEQR